MSGRFSREVWGGVLGALGSLPQTIPLGILIYSPLGSQAIVLGTTAALLSAIVGSVVSVSTGGLAAQMAGPRVSSCILTATFVSGLASREALQVGGAPHLGAAILILAVMTLLCGIIQVGFGWFRLARAVKLVPFPVLGGFNIGIALVIAAVFLPRVFEVQSFQALFDALVAHSWRWAALASAGATVAVTLAWPRRWTAVPALLAGTLAGMAVYLLLVPDAVHGQVDWRFPSLPVAVLTEDAFTRAAAYFSAGENLSIFAIYAIAISLVASLETLLSLVTYDSLENSYSDADAELKAHGTANILLGLVGGVISAGSTARTKVAYDAGARRRLSVYVHSAVLSLGLFLDDGLALLPVPIIAGIMLLIGWSMIDRWAVSRVVAAVNGKGGSARRDAALIIGTATAALAVNPLFAVLLGFILSLFFVLGDMSRPVIRSRSTGLERRSRRMRPHAQVARLAELGGLVRIWELDGLIFFGTADSIRRDAESLVRQDGRVLILDFRRVSDVDTSGIITIQRALSRVMASGWSVALCGPAEKVAPELRAPERHVLYFRDQDQALEWAEDLLLGASDGAELSVPFAAAAHELTAELTPAELSELLAISETMSIAPGQVLFQAGDPGNALYILASGLVRIELPNQTGAIRIATFMPSVVFGEMAILDGRARSATAVAEVAGHVHVLQSDALEALFVRQPAIAAKIMRNLSRTLAQRLRDTNKNFVTND